VRLAEQDYFLLFSMHQIISDGWSLGVLANELISLYDASSSGTESPLEPLPIQYADFAYWQRRWQSDHDIAAQLGYWREQLRDPLPAMQLARVRPNRIIDGLLTVRRPWALPASLSQAAKEFSHREGGTLFMALVAALKTLLRHYLGQEDVRVATLAANRNRTGTEGLIGRLANTVILRTNLGGDPSARDVMSRVRATTLAAFAHQDIPFEALLETFESGRPRRPTEFSPVMITLHNASLRPTIHCGRMLDFQEADPGTPKPLVTITPYDVVLMLHESAHGLVGSCVYKPHLFGAGAIDRLLGDFQEVLEFLVMWPERSISTIRITRIENPCNDLPNLSS
jgi:hypothetical protein